MRMRPVQLPPFPPLRFDCYLSPSFYQINSTDSSLNSDPALSQLCSPELSLAQHHHLPFLHLSHSPNSGSHLLLHLVAAQIQIGFLTYFKKLNKTLSKLSSSKNPALNSGMRTCTGFNGIMFTQVLHHPDSC